MFGFVTFIYPETVKLILAKGNPHFICDARVLVKPYKEKGKVPDKYRHASQTANPWLLVLTSWHASPTIGLIKFSLRRCAGSSTKGTSRAARRQPDWMPAGTPSISTNSVLI
jgi:hypothetical protein